MPITVSTFNATHRDASNGSPSDAFLWTPSDTAYLEHPSGAGKQVIGRGFSIAAASDIAFTMLRGNTVSFPSGYFTPGMIHPLQFLRILDTGTTVTEVAVFLN